MNLQQLRYAAEVARRGLNVSEAAAALHTSQPGVSKQLRALEAELGVDLFVRQGRRLTAVTEAGREILEIAGRVLADLASLKRVGEDFAGADRGSLAVAVTHTQARYALPPVVTAFVKRYPKVKLKLLQGNPHQLARWVLDGEADVAIATEALDRYEALVAVPGYQWHHAVVVPSRHALTRAKPLDLEANREIPDRHLRPHVRRAFRHRRGLRAPRHRARHRAHRARFRRDQVLREPRARGGAHLVRGLRPGQGPGARAAARANTCSRCRRRASPSARAPGCGDSRRNSSGSSCRTSRARR